MIVRIAAPAMAHIACHKLRFEFLVSRLARQKGPVPGISRCPAGARHTEHAEDVSLHSGVNLEA